MSNATNTQAPKGATMAAIKATMPQFFTMAPASIIKAMGDKAELPRMLALALTGAALERAQSGNAPALVGADSALDTIKGKVARQSVDNALSHVRGIKARALSGQALDAYQAYANEMHSQLSELLAPAPAKPKAPAVNWKDRAEKAEAAHAALMAYAEDLREQLTTVGGTPSPFPVGAYLPATTAADIAVALM